MSEPYRLFAGIDWAKDEHTVCVLDSDRRQIERGAFKHSGEGLRRLADLLVKLSDGHPECVAVSIETPRGAVVETLVERGFAVYSLNPKQMDRFRDRHSVAGAKDDQLDALVLADALSTDRPLFRQVRLDDPLIIRIRELSRTEEAMQHDQMRVANQLGDLLNRYYPQLLSLCPAADESWIWDLIEMAPLPAEATSLSKSKLEKLLRANRIRRLDADAVQHALSVPALKLAPGAAEAASEHALLLLPLLRLLLQQKKDLERRIAALLEEMSTEGQFSGHRDVVVLLSLPGVGRVISATMLAEASQLLAERDYHALRNYGGTAPITRSSGKSKRVLMRRSCNERLREVLYHWSRVSTQTDERSKAHYAELRAKGHRHGRALRGVADRLLAVLVAMLASGTTYDPARRVAASH
ncbi:MAG TPA: IS110 family transposase [Acidobacteriaceae bacterium]|jgi:transposase|nr:IS110 family transposase [Acidobacteriaceae bacterium]